MGSPLVLLRAASPFEAVLTVFAALDATSFSALRFEAAPGGDIGKARGYRQRLEARELVLLISQKLQETNIQCSVTKEPYAGCSLALLVDTEAKTCLVRVAQLLRFQGLSPHRRQKKTDKLPSRFCKNG